MRGTFRSLARFNYRVWAAGALVSNVGTWMQRTAQTWLVISQLTAHNATAVGIVMALQFGPLLLLLPLTGYAADHFDRRRLLMATQASMGALALVLGLLTLAGVVTLWHVYLLAFLLGCATAFDSPARQTFVAELVGDQDLSNAVALNSTSFNAARMVGPAIAGLLIAQVGSGWVFVVNAVSFAAVIASLCTLRVGELHRKERVASTRRAFADGFRYVAGRADLLAVLSMLFLIGTFGLNFQLFISAMSVNVFRVDAGAYGFLMSVMAIGSVAGALLSARRQAPRMGVLLGASLLFGIGLTLAAAMPTYAGFALALVLVGVSAQTITTTASSLVQLSTDPQMRGRVMAIFLAVALGGTPLGAPIVGWVADHFGSRWAVAMGGASGFLAAVIGLRYRLRHPPLKVALPEPGRPR